MQWVILSLISAFLLGFYDIFKKSTVVNNAIIPVLFYSTMISALIFLPFIVISWLCPDAFSEGHWNIFYVESISWRQHLLILGKTALILASWMFSYSAMKNLPITVALYLIVPKFGFSSWLSCGLDDLLQLDYN